MAKEIRFNVVLKMDEQDWGDISAKSEEEAEKKVENMISTGDIVPVELDYELQPYCEVCKEVILEDGCDCEDEE